ncbi:MAG: hypothetical protein ACSLE4_10845 [Methyloceanibacter sp.]|uniref:hypothetical protein n=1 Tax=Methyloceanibacter sp. TaxID=1965321 RepID=UPI003EE1AB83
MPTKDQLSFEREVREDWAVFVPAGTWHNITNIGDVPIRLYAIYGHRITATAQCTQLKATRKTIRTNIE